MKVHRIPLETIAPKGKIMSRLEDEGLHLSAARVLDKNAGYAWLPSAYELPFRIDMTLKANSSDFRLGIGKGYVHFSAPINHSGGGIRRADILTGREETPKHDYDCDVPLNAFTCVSVIYGSRRAWVEIDGKCCYSTAKAPYMQEDFSDNLNIRIGCGRNVEMTIQDIIVTEYGEGEPEIPVEVANLPELGPFDWYIKSLPRPLRQEAAKTDDFLMKDMKNLLKFKRSMDKYGNVIYASPRGYQYKLRKFIAGASDESSDAGVQHESGKHETGWTASRTADSAKKPDDTPEILRILAKTDPEFAARMFAQLKACNGVHCKRNTEVAYGGVSKRTCGSAILHEWTPSAFQDVRRVVAAAAEAAKIC